MYCRAEGDFSEYKSSSPQTTGHGEEEVGPHGDVGRPGRGCLRYTIPFRSSSSGYFVPRHTIPSFHSVSTIDRNSV